MPRFALRPFLYAERSRGGICVKSNMGNRCEGTWVTPSQSGNVTVYEGIVLGGKCCEFEMTITSDEHISLFAGAKLNALSCHGLAQVDLKVSAKTDVSPIIHLAHMKLDSVLERHNPLRKTPLASIQ